MAQQQGFRLVSIRHAAALIVLAFIWLAMLLSGRGAVDRSIAEALYAGGRPQLIAAARFFSDIGEPTVVLVLGFLVAAWLWLKGRTRLGFGLLLVVLVGRGLTEIQKYWVARARPDFEPHLVVVKTSSFPSGHAANSMILGLALALALTRSGTARRIAVALAIILSLFIGASRVTLGVHWPSDVIGGWAFGMLWVLLTQRRAGRLFGFREEPETVRSIPSEGRAK